jgi:outer membrane lipoprotein carrier protein
MAVILAACDLLPASAAEPPAARLEGFLEGLESLSADFEQVLMDETGEELERSTGVVYIQRPGKFHWSYRDPFPQTIVCDGRSLWIYDEDLEQVTVRDVSDSLEDSPAALLGGDVDVDALYAVIDLGETEGVAWLELTPRDVDSEYRAVRLGFRGEEPAGMVLFDNLGQKTRITFHDVQRNVDLDADLFSFTPPAGADVIDER